MKKYFAIAIAALALAACAKEAPKQTTDSREVRFTTSASTFTMKAGETALEGRTVNIVAGAPISANSTATVVGNSLTLANKIYWQDGQTAKTSFVGLAAGADYAVPEATLSSNFEINDNDYASNFLVAAAKDVEPGSTVNLDFKHPFSKITVKIDNQLPAGKKVKGVVIRNVAVNATLDYVEGTATPNGIGEIVASKLENDDWYGIVMPQEGQPQIFIYAGYDDTTEESIYEFVLASKFTFEAGKAYTANITLTDPEAPVQGEAVAFTINVTDWEEAAEALDVKEPVATRILVNNASAWENLYLYGWAPNQVDSDFLGAWPGTKITETVTIGENTYAAIEISKVHFGASWNLIFNNGNGGTGNQVEGYVATFLGEDIILKVTEEAIIPAN